MTSKFHSFQPEESFSDEVLQSLNQTTFANHDHTISPTTDTDSDRPSIPEKRKNRNGRNRNSAKEPDSGISSTIGSATRPWSQTDATMDLDQVNPNIYVKICSLKIGGYYKIFIKFW